MQLFDLGRQCCDPSAVIDHIICDCKSLFARGLRGEDAIGVVA